MTIEDRVRRVLAEAVADEPPPRGAPLQAAIRRRSRRPVLVGAAALLLVLAAVVSLVAVRRPDRVVPATPTTPTLPTLPTTGWPEVTDGAGNFRFRYPPGWEADLIRKGLWALAPRGIPRDQGLPAFEVRVRSARSLWRSQGYWQPSTAETGRLPAGQAYLFSFHPPTHHGAYFVDWGRRCGKPAAPGSCRPYSVQVEFRSATGAPSWDRYRAEVQTVVASLRPLRPTAPTVGDRSRPACRAEQWELAKPDVIVSASAEPILVVPVGVHFRGGWPCHLRAPVSMAIQQDGRLVEVRGNPAPATLELDLPEDALPDTYQGAGEDRMLQAWVWDHPCRSPRAPSRPARIRRIDLVFSDGHGRRLLAINNIGQGPETPICGDRGRPSVLAAWP